MNIGRAFGSMASITILSRLSGFLRLAVFAAWFGGGLDADIFLSVMILPDVLYKFMAEGLITSSAVPIFVRARSTPETASPSFWTLFRGISLLALPITLALIWWADPICGLMVPGFIPESKARLAELWRIICPYILLSLTGSLLTAFLNAHDSFGLPALGPIWVNLCVIAGTILSEGKNLHVLGWSVLIGAVGQFCWLFLLARQSGLLWATKGPEPLPWQPLKEFLRQTTPIAFWILLTPIIPLFERYLVSSLPQGSVAIVNYSDKILNLPLGIVSLSLASAVFPRLSRARGEKLETLVGHSLWGLVMVLLPIELIMFSGAHGLTEILYQRGQFGATEVLLTGNLLQIYSLAILPCSLAMLLNRILFATGNFQFPFLAGLLAVVLQVGIDSWLIGVVGLSGLGWGAFAAAVFQMTLLLMGVRWTRGQETFKKACLPILAITGAFLILFQPCLHLVAFLFFRLPDAKWIKLVVLAMIWFSLQAASTGFLWSRIRKTFLESEPHPVPSP